MVGPLQMTGTGLTPPRKEGDVGFDILTLHECTLLPYERRLVLSAARVQLPDDTFGMILPRSSANLDEDILVLPGVIDTGFRGRLGAIVHNLSDRPLYIHAGQRLAQLVVLPAVVPKLVRVKELSHSERDESGFGSSGR